MASWVYIFSRFTPEALLFEALAIFVLCGSYAAFWVLRKRKLGAIDQAVPVGVVKTYLNELIVDAEQLRTQLFGLLRSAGISVEMPAGQATAGAPATATVTTADPALLQKVSQLEARMAEQAQMMNALLLEKQQIEKDLAQARSAKSEAPAGGGGDAAVVNELQGKIQNLEGKLAEYSVIEDDLANLKRLQQENAQLKAALKGGAGAVSTGAPATLAADPIPVAMPGASEPAPVPAEPSVDAILAGTAGSSGSDLTNAFDGLVDQVEQSLQSAPAPAAAAPAEPAIMAETSTLAIPGDSMEKSDADLVAEFEKMLKP
jgi:hypothetical protein